MLIYGGGGGVFAEEGDELISTDLAERERLQERLDLKKKKPVYNAYEEEESGEKRILAQYDEEIDGKKKRFVLDGTWERCYRRRRSSQRSGGRTQGRSYLSL